MKCPRCGSAKVVKNGTTHHRGSPTGIQKYRCLDKASPHLDKHGVCWSGTQPIGIEEARSSGIDATLVDALHRKMRVAKRFVITAAQNATPVHGPFLASLLSYCRVNRAQLVVVPYRYKNPTSAWTELQEEQDHWAPEIQPYLYNRRYSIDRHLMLLGDIMTQPTAARPLQGFETISGKQSAIIGHPKLELTCVPTPQSRLPKIMTTTGAVTRKNYVQAKAGAKGEHHHTFGACVVELKDGLFHMRQLNALNDGSFMDLDTEYRGDSIERGIPLEYLNMGDTHEEFVSPQVVHGTFASGGIVPRLKPKRLFWHDLHDFYARNHHHRGDPFTQIAKHRSGMDNVEAALRKTFAFLDKYTPPGIESIVVASNHPAALSRWIKEADWKTDPVNAEFYLKTALAMTQGAKMTDIGAGTIDPFVMWGKAWLKSLERVRFLASDESCVVNGVENTYHGDKGANGSRGSIRQFGKIGVKTNIGHGHSPGICDGCFQGGTSTPLKLEYTGGPSSWMNTHIAGYRNGKRTLVHIIDGKWRG